MIVLDWETLAGDENLGLTTERARVLGGWLVRSRTPGGVIDAGAVAMTFVPDSHAAWDQDSD